jgi:hypothetical protein
MWGYGVVPGLNQHPMLSAVYLPAEGPSGPDTASLGNYFLHGNGAIVNLCKIQKKAPEHVGIDRSRANNNPAWGTGFFNSH